MKILLIHHDKKPWASYRRAESLKKEWVNNEVDIAYFKDLPDGDKYDVIHFLFSGGLSKCKEYILKHKHKVFTTLASQRTLDEKYDKLEDLKEIYQNTVYCVAQNKELVRQFELLTGQHNVTYIPNGVNEKLFKNEFKVGFVGTKDSDGHKGLLLIRQACDELGLDLLSCNTEYERMPDFYDEVNCLVLASLSEGCNNPTLEALAMNKPVISTNVGIASELNGVILIERNVESIKKALRVLSGRIQILEEYTWDKIAQRYYNLYHNV